MQYRLLQGEDPQASTISRFYGLNRREKGRNGEFADMLGLSSDRYPCIAPARSAKKLIFDDEVTNIQAVIEPKRVMSLEGFTGVADGKFYYNNSNAPVMFRDSSMTIPTDAEVTLVDFNGRIIICAYGGGESRMYYYDTTGRTSGGYVERMEKGVWGMKECIAHSKGNPNTDTEVINYLTGTDSNGNEIKDWTEYFTSGDAVFIEGFESGENNTLDIDSRYQVSDRSRPVSCVVEKTDGDKLYVLLYNHLHERLVFTEEMGNNINIYVNIPTMNHICIHNNRLWGTNPNGEYVYASKLGDPFNWNTFQGLASDSYYVEVGTPGDFVGIVSYRDNLVALKEDYIHHIYGDKPSNFSMPKQLSDCGCIDIRSAVQIGTSLYFLGYNGFYEYTGGQPEIISDKLDARYTGAVAATDGQKYIVSCKGTDGEDELLVYDTRYGLWHKEEYIDAVGYFRRGGKLYIGTKAAVYEYGGGDVGEWQCESTVIHENTFENKGMIELWIRAKLGEGSYVKVYTSEDGGDWILHRTLTEKGLKVYHIPIRFITGEYYQFRLEGKGNAVIYDIERRSDISGRQYRE